MEAADVVLSEWVEELCQDMDVDPDEIRRARVDGTVVFEESRVEDDYIAIWGPRRHDGTHLHIVCWPDAVTVNDFRILRQKPDYTARLMGVRPIDL